MQNRSSESTRRAMALAAEEAVRLHHHHLGTEHLLLGVLAEGDNAAAQALGRLGVTLQSARTKVSELAAPGEAGPGLAEPLPLTPRARAVIVLAVEQADWRRADLVEPGHLVLALLGEGEGFGARVLVALGATEPRVRVALGEES